MGLTPPVPSFGGDRPPPSSEGGRDAEAGAAVLEVNVGRAMDLVPGNPGGGGGGGRPLLALWSCTPSFPVGFCFLDW